MPNNPFGNPFAVPQVQVTSLRTKLPDANASLAALMKMQQAQQRMALAAARAAGGGRGRTPQEGDLRYGRYVMVPQKDGTKKPTWVWGTSQKERDAQESKVLGEAAQAIISGDAKLQKDLADFENLSVPGRKEVLDRVRQQHAPRLAQLTGMRGEELLKQLTTRLDKSIDDREKAIKEAGVGTQLVQAGKQIFRNIKDAIGAIGETSAEQRARGQANAEATAQDIRENAFRDEIQRLEAEGRSSLGFQLDNWGRSAVMHATPLAAMIAPAIAGGTIGTLVAPGPGTLGGLVSGATVGAGIGGAIGAGLPAAGEALARVATDPNLTEEQKEDTIGQTALASGLTAGAIGAIPVGPANLLRPMLVKRALAKALPEGISGTVARQLTPTATAAEKAAAERAFVQAQTKAWTPNLWQQMGLHGANAATLGGAFQVGSNAAYGWGTGQDVPLTEGLGEAMLSGAVLGVPFGIGGRMGARRRGQRVGLNPQAQPNWENLGGTWAANLKARPTVNADKRFIREVDLRNMNLPAIYEPGQAPAVADIPPIPTRLIIPPESPIPQPAGQVNPELAAAPNRWQRTPLPAGGGPIVSPPGEINPQLPPPGAWPMGTGEQARPYATPEAVRRQNLRDKIAREMTELATRRAAEDARLQAKQAEEAAQLQARQAEEMRKNLEEWRQSLQPKPRQNTTVKSERTLEERGGTPLFKQSVTPGKPDPNPDPLGVLHRNRRQPLPGQAPDMVQLANADFISKKPSFDAVHARVDNAQSPEEITDLLKRGIEANAISRAEVEVIAQNVANDALRYQAVQHALETAKEPPKPVSKEDKFFATNPGYNEIYAYIDSLNSSTALRPTANIIKRAILENRLTPEQAEIMAQDFAAQLEAGDKANEVKGIRIGIEEAAAEQAERDLAEVDNAREPTYQASDGREQAPYMESNERIRQSRPDGTDNAIDSTVQGNTPPITPATPNNPVEQVVTGSATPQGRGVVGAAPQNTRQIETPPAVTPVQGSGRTENSIGERSVEPAAASNAAGSTGQRSPEPAPAQRPRNAGNAEQINAEPVAPQATSQTTPTQQPAPQATSMQQPVSRPTQQTAVIGRRASVSEVVSSTKKSDDLTSIVQKKLLDGELTPKAVRDFLGTVKEKWQKNSLTEALELHEARQKLPDTAAGASPETLAEIQKFVRTEARVFLWEDGARDSRVFTKVKKSSWEELKNYLLGVGTRLPSKAQKLLDELAAPEIEKRRAIPKPKPALSKKAVAYIDNEIRAQHINAKEWAEETFGDDRESLITNTRSVEDVRERLQDPTNTIYDVRTEVLLGRKVLGKDKEADAKVDALFHEYFNDPEINERLQHAERDDFDGVVSDILDNGPALAKVEAETVATPPEPAPQIKSIPDDGKPFTERTYAITKKNLTPLLVDKLKRANRTESEAYDYIEYDDWGEIRELLNRTRQLDPTLENTLKRLDDYSTQHSELSLDNIDLGLEKAQQEVAKIEKVVEEVAKNPVTTETLEKAKQVIDNADAAIESVQTAKTATKKRARKKAEDAKTVLEEHAKPEEEPVAQEYNKIKDGKLLEEQTPTESQEQYITPEDLAIVQVKLWDLARNNENGISTLKSLVGEKKIGKRADGTEKDAQELVNTLTDIYRRYYERDPNMPKNEVNAYKKMKAWLGLNGVQEMEPVKGKRPDNYDELVNSEFIANLEARAEFAAEEAADRALMEEQAAADRAVYETQTTPEGIYQKQINTLTSSLNKKFAKIWPGKEKTKDGVKAAVTAFIKAATGEKLTPKEQALYNDATAKGVKSLVINKTGVEETAIRGQAQGYETTKAEAATTAPTESATKIRRNGRKCT